MMMALMELITDHPPVHHAALSLNSPQLSNYAQSYAYMLTAMTARTARTSNSCHHA